MPLSHLWSDPTMLRIGEGEKQSGWERLRAWKEGKCNNILNHVIDAISGLQNCFPVSYGKKRSSFCKTKYQSQVRESPLFYFALSRKEAYTQAE